MEVLGELARIIIILYFKRLTDLYSNHDARL